MFKFKLGFFLCLLLPASVALADSLSQEDFNWLKKIAVAAHQTNYSGTFIYQSGNHFETLRITHLFDGGNEYDRLEGLDGERSEVIRKNDKVWCYLGESRVMVESREGARTFPALLPEQLSLLQENYVIRHGEEDRVAGFHAHSILFQPRDKMRYAHKIWVHSASGLLLKAVMLDERNAVIEQYAFTHLNMDGDIDRKWIAAKQSAETGASGNKASFPSANATPSESGWNVYALPPGFVKITEVKRNLRGNRMPVVHLVYSDGLAGISVFIEPLGDKQGVKQGLSSKGVVQVFTSILDSNVLTVVGEVPPHTVRQVAEAVRYGRLPK